MKLLIAAIGEALANWWQDIHQRSRAKDDYLHVAKLQLKVLDPFPGEEDMLFAQLDKQDF